MKVYLVAAPCGEFVGFLVKQDACYASTGIHTGFGVSMLAQDFRECYADDDWGMDDDDSDDEATEFPMIEVDLTPEQVAACKFDIK
jgi:hypothetical protein